MVSGSEVILTTAKNKFEKLEQPKSFDLNLAPRAS